MTYRILVDDQFITTIEGPENMTEIQRRIIVEGFAADRRISAKGVRVTV